MSGLHDTIIAPMWLGMILLFCAYCASAQKIPLDRSEGTPNFAAHYQVSTVACGNSEYPGSLKLALRDILTGETREDEYCYWRGYKKYGRADLPTTLSYKTKSSLLVISGCRTPDPACATFYYQLKSDGLRLVRLVPFRPPINIE